MKKTKHSKFNYKIIFGDRFFNISILLTTILVFICFANILINKYAYIYLDIGADTYSSYWPTYTFFRNMVISGKFSFWSFSRGLGESTFSTFQLLFDPYNLILFLFTPENIDLGILTVSMLKIFTTSIFSFLYFKKIGIKEYTLIFVTLCYTFNGYFIGWGQHYNFASMFVMFTFLLYSFECWNIDKEWKLLSFSVFIICINSVYFAYMIFVFMIFYAIFRYFFLLKTELGIIKYIITTLGVVLIGVGLSSLILLPSCLAMLNTPRVGIKQIPIMKIADIKELVSIFMRFFSNNILGINEYLGYVNYYESPFLFVGVIGTILLPGYLWIKRKNTNIISISIIILIIIFSPNISNPIMNALSAYTYRWTFCLIPIFCIGIAKAFDIVINECRFRQVFCVFGLINVCMIITYVLNISGYKINSLSKEIIYSSSVITILLLLLYIFVLMFSNNKSKNIVSWSLIIILLFDLGSNAFISINKRSLITHEYAINSSYFDESNIALDKIKGIDKDWYRVSKDFSQIDLLDPLVQNYKGEKLYSSTLSKEILDLMDVFDLKIKNSNYFYGFGENIDLKNILSFKYLLSKVNTKYDNYNLIDKVGDISIFQSEIILPFGFAYENCISYKDFEKLNKIDKQMVMYNAFVAESKYDFNNFKNYNYLEKQKKIEAEIIDYSGVNMLYDNFPEKLSMNSSSNNLIINFQLGNETKSSSVINFRMRSDKESKGRLYFASKGEEFNDEKSVEFEIIGGLDDYYINLPINNISRLKIDVSKEFGSATLSDFKVFEKDYSEIKNILNLKSKSNESLIIESYSEDLITGNINLTKDSMLFLPIPFDNNWMVKIDGENTKTEKINISFTGVELDKGFHKVEIRYKPKGFFMGSIVSIIFLLGIIVKLMFSKRNNHK